MKFDLFKYLSALGLLYIIGRLLLHYALFAIRYFLNEQTLWNPRIEKPRFLFHLLGLSIMLFIFQSHSNWPTDHVLLRVFMAMAFITAFFFCQVTWSGRFRNSFLPSKTISKPSAHENFRLKISEMELVQLYNDLVRFDLMDQDLTTSSDFRTVFTKNWKEHNSRIHLTMDSPSAREFLDHLIRTFPEKNLTIKNFFQTSDLVRRADGQPYKYNTVKNAPSRSLYSKKHAELNKIFRKYD